MTTVALVRGDPPWLLWGLPSVERIKRQLRSIGISEFLSDRGDAAQHESVLIVDARYLYETRTLSVLLEHRGTVVRDPRSGRMAAAFATGHDVDAYIDAFFDTRSEAPAGARVLDPEALDSYDEELRRGAAPLLEVMTPDNLRALESLLYGNAYKGITDLVTKWWWPRPARTLVHLCARAGISPNTVTVTGLILVIATTVLFAYGYFLAGLACGWIMTLLDTVDGKLARVTVQSSRFGHFLDHGMDIVHPPFWYVVWANGLGVDAIGPFSVHTVAVAIVAAYIGGRVVEGVFPVLGKCTLFSWRPFDAYFRLITARRNPCLIILSVATLCARPDLGILGVAVWTVLSSAIMVARLAYAVVVRLSGASLESWLNDGEAAAIRYPRAYRTFSSTRGAYV